MIPVGVGVVFAAYTTGIWGYCLVRGYNVKFTQLFAATWPGTGKSPAAQFGQEAATVAAAKPVAVRLPFPGPGGQGH